MNEEPLIILGHQKCGTSIVAALLAELSAKTVAIDLMREVEVPTFHLLQDGGLELEDFLRRNRLEFSRDIVKEANLTPLHDRLRARFPEARFGFVQRDPRDNLRSILQRLGLPGRPEEASSEQLQAISPAWKLVLDGHWLGLEGEDYIAQLAARWQAFADIALEAGGAMPVLRYEDFRRDKVASIRDFAVRLGLPCRNDISDRVDVQYQPRGDHRQSWEDYFGAEGLARIDAITAAGRAAFGYPDASAG